MFICKICNNSDPKYIGNKNGVLYCRKCIEYTIGEKAKSKTFFHLKKIKANINYNLTKVQEDASNKIYNYVINNKSCIVNAICGAGKTELVYKSIEYFLNNNKKVGFAIPRKDVVIDIYNRLKTDYPLVKVSMVYGGHTSNLNGELVVLTTHQMYRYSSYFDLLILDEADAYPYYGNDLLETYLNYSNKGPTIYLSATIKDSYLKITSNVVYVNRRFHNYDLPVPIYKRYYFFNKYEVLNNIITKLKRKQILIFVPTIEIGHILEKKTNYPFVYSSKDSKEKIVEDFKNNKFKILITTSILERGVTFFDVQVIVFEANHKLFDLSSLIQISGRVGRKLKAPTGFVYFLATQKSKSMKKCIKEIKSKNESEK